jgi:uncharacterized protein YceK
MKLITNKKIRRDYLISSLFTIALLLTISMFLSGCSTVASSLLKEFEPVEKIITIDKTKYPDLPNIDYPGSPLLLEFEWDYPRTQELVVLNRKKCLDTPEESRDSKFWKECGINEVDIKSNLFIGLRTSFSSSKSSLRFHSCFSRRHSLTIISLSI